MTLDYGIIGNCMSSALIKSDGSLDWWCAPRFDSPSAFARILDKDVGGTFQILPVGKYKIRQNYLKNTNVLETIFYNNKNSFRVLDFF